MFYNHDILARRRTGLGLVWLAATLGDRSIVRRLSRKEILGVEIDKVCDYVRRPGEPLALRLSSQLMYGVVKLYGLKTETLYHDVANVHNDVRRRMLTMSTTTFPTRDIDMRKPFSSVEAITLPLDLAFFTLDCVAVRWKKGRCRDTDQHQTQPAFGTRSSARTQASSYSLHPTPYKLHPPSSYHHFLLDRTRRRQTNKQASKLGSAT